MTTGTEVMRRLAAAVSKSKSASNARFLTMNLTNRSLTKRGNVIVRLIELTKQAFPDGKVPDPFSVITLSLSQDVRVAEGFPFILASHIIVTSSTDASINPPQVVLENVWCFWDTGAETSQQH